VHSTHPASPMLMRIIAALILCFVPCHAAPASTLAAFASPGPLLLRRGQQYGTALPGQRLGPLLHAWRLTSTDTPLQTAPVTMGMGGTDSSQVLPHHEERWRLAVFYTCVAFSSLVLEVADLLFRLVLAVFSPMRSFMTGMAAWAATGLTRRLFRGRASWGRMPEPRRHVVIVGASFGGLACARMLRRDFDVTIIDQHDWFEYTPGILRLLVQPQHMNGLSASLHGVTV